MFTNFKIKFLINLIRVNSLLINIIFPAKIRTINNLSLIHHEI